MGPKEAPTVACGSHTKGLRNSLGLKSETEIDVEIPTSNYLHQYIGQILLKALLHGLQSQYREMWPIGLKSIDGVQKIGNSSPDLLTRIC